MIAIVDYGVGNLFSLQSSFAALGAEVTVTGDPDVIASGEKIVLPGVGAFGDAAEKLRKSGLDRVLKEQAGAGKPLLGICLGMQLLFERSYEYGEHKGLGLLPGIIRPIAGKIPQGLKIPHMGWNALTFPGEKHPLFRYLQEGDYVYFVHSFSAEDCGDAAIALTDYGAPLTAAAARGSVMGCQFHPEKSGDVGLSILKAFLEMKEVASC